jgi:hypothetical protein
MTKKGFDLAAARRMEIERFARAIDAADSDDFRSLLIAWQWHNVGSKDPVGALVMAAKRMGGAISEKEAEHVIDEANTVPARRGADALGRFLRLSDDARTALQICTIGSFDVSKRQRAARRRRRDRARKEIQRRDAGAKPRAEFLAANTTSRLQPWKAAGISRRTWYYRRKADAQVPGSQLPVGASSASKTTGRHPTRH